MILALWHLLLDDSVVGGKDSDLLPPSSSSLSCELSVTSKDPPVVKDTRARGGAGLQDLLAGCRSSNIG